jgi:hypothetical protein
MRISVLHLDIMGGRTFTLLFFLPLSICNLMLSSPHERRALRQHIGTNPVNSMNNEHNANDCSTMPGLGALEKPESLDLLGQIERYLDLLHNYAR